LRLIVFHTTLTLNASPEAVNRRRPAFNPQNPCMPATLPIRRDSMTQTQVPDLTLADLSMLAQDDFTDRLADIFEHSPWIARGAWPARPFSDVAALHQAMLDVLADASEQAKLDLILAHPELAGKEAAGGTLTRSSTSEQKGAGLDQCSAAELQRLRALNAAYRERFGF